MEDCQKRPTAECKMMLFSRSLAKRSPPKPEDQFVKSRPTACSGGDRLNKKAFLSTIGVERYTETDQSLVSLAEQRLDEIRTVLAENDQDTSAAARILKTTPSSLRSKINALSSVVSSSFMKNEATSPSPARRYFEKLRTPWSINSYDPSKLEVCIDIKSPVGSVRLSVSIPEVKNPQ